MSEKLCLGCSSLNTSDSVSVSQQKTCSQIRALKSAFLLTCMAAERNPEKSLERYFTNKQKQFMYFFKAIFSTVAMFKFIPLTD